MKMSDCIVPQEYISYSIKFYDHKYYNLVIVDMYVLDCFSHLISEPLKRMIDYYDV